MSMKVIDSMKDGMTEMIIAEILPKAKMFLAPALEKLGEFLEGDSKIIVLRTIKGTPTVFVIDKTKTSFKITEDVFEVDNSDGVIGYYPLDENINELIEQIITKPD